MGRFFSLDTPLAPGPLHCGQFASSSTSANDGKPGRPNKQTIKVRRRPDVIRLNNPDLISIKERLRIEVIYDSTVRMMKIEPFSPGELWLQQRCSYLSDFFFVVGLGFNELV